MTEGSTEHKGGSRPWLSEGERSCTSDGVRLAAIRLAATWRQHVRPNELVGSLVHRGIDAVIIFHAAQECGCAVTFFDRSLPETSLVAAVRDAGCTLVVAAHEDAGMAARMGADGAAISIVDSAVFSGAASIVVQPAVSTARTDNFASDRERIVSSNIGSSASSTEPASFVVFSSGTTAEPKGVMLSAGHLNQAGHGQTRRHGITESDVIGELASFRFVSPIGSVFGSIAGGARLAFHDLERHGIGSLKSFLAQTGATILPIQAATMRATLAAGIDLRATQLRSVSVAGETVFGDELRRFRRLLPDHCTIRYVYGSTECAGLGVATFAPADAIPDGRISFPLADHIRIVDANLAPLPIGQTGQVVSLRPTSLGYWNRAELTSERYIPLMRSEPATESTSDTSGGNPSDVLFTTGDFGHVNADGTLTLVGRSDGRVKIRGFNIELSEVEDAILAHDEVARVAVMGVDCSGGRRLVAYVIPMPGTLPSVGGLRRFLAEHQPAHKIPSRFVVVDAFPTTSAGKTDRQALADISPPDDRRPLRLPEGQIMIETLDKQQALLGIQHLSVDDDFFEHGGDSLNAIELAAWATNRFGCDISVRDVVASPTAERLASLIESYGQSPRRKGKTVSVIAAHNDPEFAVILVSGAGDSVTSQLPLARALSASRLRIRILAVQGPGLDSLRFREGSVASFARSAIAEILVESPNLPLLIAGHSHGGVVAHEIARQLEQLHVRVLSTVLLDSPPPRLTLNSTPSKPGLARAAKGQIRRALDEVRERRAIAKLPDVREAERRRKGLVFEHQVRTARQHQPGTINAPLLIIRAAGEPDDGRFLPWSSFTRSRFAIISTNGSHASITTPLYVGAVARIIETWTEENPVDRNGAVDRASTELATSGTGPR